MKNQTLNYQSRSKPMVKLFIALLLMIMVMHGFGPITYGDVVGQDAGIMGNTMLKSGTYEFDEICFVSGEPVTLTGTVTVPTTPVSATATKYTTSYTYDLANVDKNISLSRKTTFQVDVLKDEALNQTTQKFTLIKLDEKYTVAGVAYTLARYNYNQSILLDNTPAVDYFNGNLYSERIFYKNGDVKKNDGILSIVSNSDTIVGYKHKWGSLETRVITQRLAYTPTKSSSTTVAAAGWTGSVRVNMSSQNKKSFKLMTNDPQSISFKGSYILMENQENVLKYTYDLPVFSATALSDASRNKGTKSSKKSVVLSSNSLVSPKIRDIGGHWAEKDIFLLTSLKIFDEYDRVGAVPGYFSPNVAITRMAFAKAIARSIGDVTPLTKDEIIKRDRPGFIKTFTYQDIDAKSPDASYIEFLNDRHVMIGEGQYFYPERPITRAEATTMVISALGLSDLAPQPPYKIGFVDEKVLPDWAKDYIYAANEIGLVTANKDGNFRPSALVTRADAAALVNKMINHIREKITEDYREKILNQ